MATGCKAEFKNGEQAFIVESGHRVRPVEILSEYGGLYKIRFQGGGGTCVKAGRLFRTAEEAKQTVTVRKETVRGPRSPHSFGYW